MLLDRFQYQVTIAPYILVRCDRATHAELREAYDFLRTVEGRLRLIHDRAIANLPDNPAALLGLSRRLNYQATDPVEAVRGFLADADRHSSCTRAIFERYIGSPRAAE